MAFHLCDFPTNIILPPISALRSSVTPPPLPSHRLPPPRFLIHPASTIITHIISVINAATISSHIWNSNAVITFETNSYPRQSHNLIHSAYQERNDYSNFNSLTILVRFLHTFLFFVRREGH